MVRADRLVLLIVILMTGVIGSFWFFDVSPGQTGFPHPEIGKMLKGGDASRHDGILAVGWVLGLLIQLLNLALILLGAGPKRKLGPWFVWGSILYLGIWTTLAAAYGLAASGIWENNWSGYPLPTIVAMFGIWLTPLVFMGIYYFRFDKLVYSAADKKKFEAILAKRTQARGDM
ncbi:MAG: hypothetical protein CMP10_09845 [Zetaproteobacteria bacterium]|nr:hypothetical protein [Pseudobdellovibrionaceae bacterium]